MNDSNSIQNQANPYQSQVDPFGNPVAQSQNLTDDSTAQVSSIPNASSFAGSPEAAPAPVAETVQESIEYGYEAIKNIEQNAEKSSEQEVSEPKPDLPDESMQAPEPPPIPSVPVAPKPQGPKFFGYPIPPSMTSDLSALKKKKGKGETQEAKTWMMILLDRLLRKQSKKD